MVDSVIIPILWLRGWRLEILLHLCQVGRVGDVGVGPLSQVLLFRDLGLHHYVMIPRNALRLSFFDGQQIFLPGVGEKSGRWERAGFWLKEP
jgi:hypothetical protein